jgi:hypothetical protein
MAPLNRVSVISPSAIARTSSYLKSIAHGQKTMSKNSAISSTFSSVSRTAISHPPQDAAQYRPSFGLAMLTSRVLELLLGRSPVERPFLEV